MHVHRTGIQADEVIDVAAVQRHVLDLGGADGIGQLGVFGVHRYRHVGDFHSLRHLADGQLKVQA